MKLSGTILFFIVALQQVMNYAVQAAPKACHDDPLKKCNAFKIEGATCTCTGYGEFIFINKCEVLGANLQVERCKPKTVAFKSCYTFCLANGLSCSANGCQSI